MTDLLEKAVAAIRHLPAAEQDNIAQAMLSMAKIAEPLDIEPEHLAAVMAGMAQADRGEFVAGRPARSSPAPSPGAAPASMTQNEATAHPASRCRP